MHSYAPFVERDPAKNLKNTIFKFDLSQNFMGHFINSLSFKTFLRDYNKVDFNNTTRFKNILRRKEFESSIILIFAKKYLKKFLEQK